MSPRDEYVLDPAHWPDMPSAHRAFLEAAIARLRADERLVGLAAGGSFISRTLDEHSDLDLVVVSRPEVSGEVLRDGPDIARRLGPLLATFPGDHVGEPRLFISLYGPTLLHVDFKFVSTEELAHRVEDPVILWDREGVVLGLGALRRGQDRSRRAVRGDRCARVRPCSRAGPPHPVRGGGTAERCPPRRADCAGARGRLALDPGFARPAILLEGIDSDADALQRAPRAACSADAPTQSGDRTRRQGLPRGR